MHYVAAKSNVQYWADKIARNRSRDADTDAQLEAAGWLSICVWAHDDPDAVADLVSMHVKQRANRRKSACSSASI